MGKLTSLQYLPSTLSLSNEPSGAIRSLKRRVLSIIIASTISAILFLLFFSPNHLHPSSFNPSVLFSTSSLSSLSSSVHLFGPAILTPIQIPYDPHLFGLDSPVDWNQVSLSSAIPWSEPSQWPILLTSTRLLKSPQSIPITVFPRVIQLDDRAPQPSDLIFGMTTIAQRASVISELWPSWLGSPTESGQAPLCVIVLPRSDFGKGDDDDQSPAGLLSKTLKDSRGLKNVRLTSSWLGEGARYELRYFGMLREMEETARESKRQPKWFIVSDDDTLWTDERMLRRELGNYDPDHPWLLGASSEGISQIQQFGSMAFGGAGIIISRGLCKKMLEIHADCVEETKNVFGGDEMYSLCAARAAGDGKTKETVVTQLTSLHQLDLPGDGTGFFQSGFPFLSLHHLWHGWTDAFAREHKTSFDRPDNALNHLLLLQQAARILGGDNFMRRSVYDNGRELLTLGYTVTRFDVPLKPEEMGVIEKTWSGDSEYPLRFPTRPRIIETEEVGTGGKRTYYLCEIRTSKSDPSSFTLVHRDRWGNHAEIVWRQD